MEVQSVRFSHTHTAVCSLAAFRPRRLQAEIITLGKQVAGRCGAAFTTLSASQTQKQMHVSEQSAAFQFEVPAGPGELRGCGDLTCLDPGLFSASLES